MQKQTALLSRQLLCLLVGGSLFWPLPAPAYAAQEAAERQFTLEGVEVTAARDTEDKGYVAKRSSVGSKTDTPLEETARSISVITREQLDARDVTTLWDALAYTPGISDSDYSRNAQVTAFKIRGFDNVAAYVNGLKPHYYQSMDPYSFERIEVLRGPAGVLYGANQPGGIVNQVSKQPTADDLRELQLQAGSSSLFSGALDLGGKAKADGKLLFRLTARSAEEDLPVDYSSIKNQFIAPALTWLPNENTRLTILTYYGKNEINGDSSTYHFRYLPNHALYGYPGTLFVGEPGYNRYITEQTQIGYTLEHTINDTWSVTQNFRHDNLKVRNRYLSYDWGGIADGIIGRNNSNFAADYDSDALDTYFRANWSGGAVNHVTLLGFNYYNTQNLTKSSPWNGAGPSLDLNTLNYGQQIDTPAFTSISDLKTIQRGWYLQDQLKFGRHWTAIAAGRYDQYSSNTRNLKTGAVDSRIEQSDFTKRLGLVYDNGSGLFPYLSYDESFEGQTGTDRYDKAFKPTTGQQVELGVQYVPPNSNTRFSAAIFDLRKQNILTADPLNATLGGRFNVQTGEIAARGLELEANLADWKGLNLTAAYTYMPRHKITKDNNAARLGKTTQNVSRHSASLWINTARAAQGKAASGWNYGAGLRYIGSSYDYDNTAKVGGKVLTDAMVSYDTDGWHYALNVNNLLDREYTVTSYSDIGYDYVDTTGRTIRLTATKRW